MFGFFETDKKKEDAPAPQPQQPAQPQEPKKPERIIERESSYKGTTFDSPDSVQVRRNAVFRTFGTDDLDVILSRYAPDFTAAIVGIRDGVDSLANTVAEVKDSVHAIKGEVTEMKKRLDTLEGRNPKGRSL